MPDDRLPNQEVEVLHDSLKSTLGRLEGDIKSIVDGSDHCDPDRLIDSLSTETEDLDQVLSELWSTLERVSESAPTRLDRAAQDALEHVLVEWREPLVVHSNWAPDLPGVALAAEPAAAVLRRLFVLAVRDAGWGGELSARTAQVGDSVDLRVEVVRHEPLEDAAAQRTRGVWFESLEEFFSDFGGRLTVEESGDELRVTARFPIRCATP